MHCLPAQETESQKPGHRRPNQWVWDENYMHILKALRGYLLLGRLD
jgi:hypothetical protein